MIKRILAALTALVALIACSSTADTATPSTRAAAPSTTSSEVTPEPMTAHEVCLAFIAPDDPESLLITIPDVLTSLESPMSEATISTLLEINAKLVELIEVAPADLAAILREIQLPFQQTEDVATDGGGAFTLDTGAAADGVITLVNRCGDEF